MVSRPSQHGVHAASLSFDPNASALPLASEDDPLTLRHTITIQNRLQRPHSTSRWPTRCTRRMRAPTATAAPPLRFARPALPLSSSRISHRGPLPHDARANPSVCAFRASSSAGHRTDRIELRSRSRGDRTPSSATVRCGVVTWPCVTAAEGRGVVSSGTGSVDSGSRGTGALEATLRSLATLRASPPFPGDGGADGFVTKSGGTRACSGANFLSISHNPTETLSRRTITETSTTIRLLGTNALLLLLPPLLLLLLSPRDMALSSTNVSSSAVARTSCTP